MSRSDLIVAFFITALISLIVTTATRNVLQHESSVLNGLEIQVIVISVLFAILYSYGNLRPSYLAIFSGAYVATFSMLPSLKYLLPYGSADALGHLSLIEIIQSSGKVPELWYYSDFPSFHIFHVEIALVSGIPTWQLFKLLTPGLSFLYPLLSYSLVSRLTADVELKRLASFVPSILYTGEPWAFYYIAPAMFSLLIITMLYFLLVCGKLSDNRFGQGALTTILALALVTLHHYSLAILVAILGGTVVLSVVTRLDSLRFPLCFRGVTGIAVLLLVSSFSWWFLVARVPMEFIYSVFVEGQILLRPPVGAGLGQSSLPAWARLVFVQYGGKIVLLVLLFPSWIGVLKRQFTSRIRDRRAKASSTTCRPIALTLITASWLVVLVMVFFSRFANVQQYRIFLFGLVISSPFCARTIRRVSKSLCNALGDSRGCFLKATFLVVLLLVPLGEFFPNDDIRPRAVYNQVNSISQYDALSFLSGNSNIQIASDTVTIQQARGFFGSGLYLRMVSRYSGDRSAILNDLLLYQKSCSSTALVMIHRPALGGAYGERQFDSMPDSQLDANVLRALAIGNVLYSNSQTFVLSCMQT